LSRKIYRVNLQCSPAAFRNFFTGIKGDCASSSSPAQNPRKFQFLPQEEQHCQGCLEVLLCGDTRAPPPKHRRPRNNQWQKEMKRHGDGEKRQTGQPQKRGSRTASGRRSVPPACQAAQHSPPALLIESCFQFLPNSLKTGI